MPSLIATRLVQASARAHQLTAMTIVGDLLRCTSGPIQGWPAFGRCRRSRTARGGLVSIFSWVWILDESADRRARCGRLWAYLQKVAPRPRKLTIERRAFTVAIAAMADLTALSTSGRLKWAHHPGRVVVVALFVLQERDLRSR